MQMIKRNIDIWHIKETHFTLLRKISGLPITAVKTAASQERAVYHLLHSCGKYVENQATEQGSNKRERGFECLVYVLLKVTCVVLEV
jgi:hypothetical protein